MELTFRKDWVKEALKAHEGDGERELLDIVAIMTDVASPKNPLLKYSENGVTAK